MKLVIAAKRLYDNGTVDDESLRELVVTDPPRWQHAEQIGDFLLEYTKHSLGRELDDATCDAIDVTISRAL